MSEKVEQAIRYRCKKTGTVVNYLTCCYCEYFDFITDEFEVFCNYDTKSRTGDM